MTTFAGWVQSTYAMIKHPLRGQKYDLKHAREPVVHGFSRTPTSRAKWPSDITLTTLNNRTVRQYSEDKASGTAPIVATSPKRVMSPPSSVSNPSRSDNNGGWLHTHWKPGQVKAGIDFFERVAAASVQGAPVRPSSPTASIKVKRPASPPPEPPKPVVVSRHGKTKRAPLPPQPVPVQAKTSTATRGPGTSKPVPKAPTQTVVQPLVKKEVTAPTKTFMPPPAPPADGLKLFQRTESEPALSRPDMSAVFAQLSGHRLVRSDSAPPTTGTARDTSSTTISTVSRTDADNGQQHISIASQTPPREKLPLNDFQRELMKKTTLRTKTKPIKVKAEVNRQAAELRATREALQRDNLMLKPWRGAQQGSQASVLSASETFNALRPPSTDQVNLIDELVKGQVALGLRTRIQQSG